MGDLSAVLVFAFVTIFTPGPNNILSSSMGALYGLRRALPLMLGVATGFVMIMIASLGVSAVLTARFPSAIPGLRVAGAVYVLWLAWGVYRGGGRLHQSDKASKPLGFVSGLVLQLANAKVMLFGLTVFSGFLVPLTESGPKALLWVAPPALGILCLSSVFLWALGGHIIRRWLSTPRRARVVAIVFAAALVYAAVDLSGIPKLLP